MRPRLQGQMAGYGHLFRGLWCCPLLGLIPSLQREGSALLSVCHPQVQPRTRAQAEVVCRKTASGSSSSSSSSSHSSPLPQPPPLPPYHPPPLPVLLSRPCTSTRLRPDPEFPPFSGAQGVSCPGPGAAELKDPFLSLRKAGSSSPQIMSSLELPANRPGQARGWPGLGGHSLVGAIQDPSVEVGGRRWTPLVKCRSFLPEPWPQFQERL